MSECSEQEVARLLPLVSEQRREQALCYKHTFGQYCCLKAYVMLCELLAEWGRIHQHTAIEQPIFLYNEHGAPRIENGPHISLSHCKNGIAVAVSNEQIGIDIEVVRPLKEELVRKTMNLDEQQQIMLSLLLILLSPLLRVLLLTALSLTSLLMLIQSLRPEIMLLK